MGVSGSGKSTIGIKLAKKLNWIFYDGDDFHPESNIRKMRQGIALTDGDRATWLQTLQTLIWDLIQRPQSTVIACSALKHSYRKTLQVDDEKVQFVFLNGSQELIQARLQQRQNHFMSSQLLDSQFETLEVPGDIFTVEIATNPDAIVHQICLHWNLEPDSIE